MTGWRVGWLLGPGDVVKAATNLQSHQTSNVNNVAQRAAIAALEGDLTAVAEMREAFDRRRRTMVRMLNEIPGVECPEPTGAFYAYPSARGTRRRGSRSASDHRAPAAVEGLRISATAVRSPSSAAIAALRDVVDVGGLVGLEVRGGLDDVPDFGGRPDPPAGHHVGLRDAVHHMRASPTRRSPCRRRSGARLVGDHQSSCSSSHAPIAATSGGTRRRPWGSTASRTPSPSCGR